MNFKQNNNFVHTVVSKILLLVRTLDEVRATKCILFTIHTDVGLCFIEKNCVSFWSVLIPEPPPTIPLWASVIKSQRTTRYLYDSWYCVEGKVFCS